MLLIRRIKNAPKYFIYYLFVLFLKLDLWFIYEKQMLLIMLLDI